MRTRMFAFLLILAAGAGTGSARAQAVDRVTDLGPYLMADRQAEIALARTAAPASVTDHARILVLGPGGYEVAVPGTNGFVCLVGRSWNGPFDSRLFDPTNRGPACYNPAAAASIMPLDMRRTALMLAHLTRDEVLDSMRAWPRQYPAPGAMGYMLSKDQSLGGGDHWMPHLMFYVPRADSAQWVADVDGAPALSFGQYEAEHQPIAEFLVPVRKWSDGSPALPVASPPARSAAARR